MREIDLSGRSAGYWTVLFRNGVTPDGKMPLWRCRCQCGAERDVRAGNIRNGLTKSCGCMKPSPKVFRKPVSEGEKYGRLLVLKRLPGSEVLCRCVCGSERAYKVGNLSTGKSKSCGCLRREMTADKSFRHGMIQHPAHRSWASAKDRCRNSNNQDFHLYGGRGITFAVGWEHFKDFWLDMGPTWFKGGTLDRIDGNLGYEPGNCRWITIQAQQSNKCTNVYLDTPWGRMTLSQAAKRIGIGPSVLANRIRNKWPEDRLFLESQRQWTRRKRA